VSKRYAKVNNQLAEGYDPVNQEIRAEFLHGERYCSWARTHDDDGDGVLL